MRALFIFLVKDETYKLLINLNYLYMKKIILKAAALFLITVITSCVSSKKFDFDSAYKFSK